MAFIRNITITNNRGKVNLGNRYTLTPVSVSKLYSGSGGNSSATILNGRRTPQALTGPMERVRSLSVDVSVDVSTETA